VGQDDLELRHGQQLARPTPHPLGPQDQRRGAGLDERLMALVGDGDRRPAGVPVQQQAGAAEAGSCSICGRTSERKTSRWSSIWSRRSRMKVTRTQPPAGVEPARCSSPTCQVRTSGRLPNTSCARIRSGATSAALARSSASDSQAVVMMQVPDPRSASIDSPTQPGTSCTAGSTSSRTTAMPVSRSSGRPVNVVDLACMTPPLPAAARLAPARSVLVRSRRRKDLFG
jgi:hypothetical protein